jgi:transcriptional regulator with XRE-family HTH domain
MGTVIKFPDMTIKMENPPNRIREWRIDRELKQRELGDMVGLTGVMISHLETGRRDPGLKQLQSIARALKVDTVDLLAREDNPVLMTDDARDFMRVYAHIPDTARSGLQQVAEAMAGFKAQPAVLPMPGADDSGATAKPGKKGRDAA